MLYSPFTPKTIWKSIHFTVIALIVQLVPDGFGGSGPGATLPSKRYVKIFILLLLYAV